MIRGAISEPYEDILKREVLWDLKFLAKVLHENHLICGEHAFNGIRHEPREQGRGDSSVHHLKSRQLCRLVECALTFSFTTISTDCDHGFNGGGQEIGGDDSGLGNLKGPSPIVWRVLGCVEYILGEIQLRIKGFEYLFDNHGGRKLA